MTLFLLYKFHFIASKYAQVFMRTPKKWQNSHPVDGGHWMEEEEEEEEEAICIQQRAATILEMCSKMRLGYTTYVLLSVKS